MTTPNNQDRLLSDEDIKYGLLALKDEAGNYVINSLGVTTPEPLHALIAFINTQKRLYAESEKLKELNRVYFEAMANSRENLLERILQRMKFCEEELGSAESED